MIVKVFRKKILLILLCDCHTETNVRGHEDYHLFSLLYVYFVVTVWFL